MNIQRLMILTNKTRFIIPKVIFTTHNESCPEYISKKKTEKSNGTLKRALKSGKVRLGFIPDEFFTFFYTKTGVTGPYLFGIMLLNYLISKEIYVMEHEYYAGLSIFLIMYYGTKKLGPSIAESLDKDVESVEAEFNKSRRDEEMHYEGIIKEAKDAQWRANGQQLLIEAKKENVDMQLEAAYRERLMHVYSSVKRRLEYHSKLHRVEKRIHQKWMNIWIVENVLKAITPDIEQKAISQAIADLAALADKAK